MRLSKQSRIIDLTLNTVFYEKFKTICVLVVVSFPKVDGVGVKIDKVGKRRRVTGPLGQALCLRHRQHRRYHLQRCHCHHHGHNQHHHWRLARWDSLSAFVIVIVIVTLTSSSATGLLGQSFCLHHQRCHHHGHRQQQVNIVIIIVMVIVNIIISNRPIVNIVLPMISLQLIIITTTTKLASFQKIILF